RALRQRGDLAAAGEVRTDRHEPDDPRRVGSDLRTLPIAVAISTAVRLKADPTPVRLSQLFVPVRSPRRRTLRLSDDHNVCSGADPPEGGPYTCSCRVRLQPDRLTCGRHACERHVDEVRLALKREGDADGRRRRLLDGAATADPALPG